MKTYNKTRDRYSSQRAKVNIDPKFAEFTADGVGIILLTYYWH